MTLAAITTFPKIAHNTSTLNTGETLSNYSVKLSLSPYKGLVKKYRGGGPEQREGES